MSQARPRIAVCDDDLPFVELMDEVLAEEGYDTICCLDGVKAFETIQREIPDLVILDLCIQTPDAGFTVLDMLRLDRTTTHIPVILCSAATQLLSANAEQLHKQNCDILEKPFDLETLLIKIRAIVEPAASS